MHTAVIAFQFDKRQGTNLFPAKLDVNSLHQANLKKPTTDSLKEGILPLIIVEPNILLFKKKDDPAELLTDESQNEL